MKLLVFTEEFVRTGFALQFIWGSILFPVEERRVVSGTGIGIKEIVIFCFSNVECFV